MSSPIPKTESQASVQVYEMSSLYAGSQRELLPTPQKHGHPRQWGKTRKMYDTCLIIFLEFFTYVQTSLYDHKRTDSVAFSTMVSTAGVSLPDSLAYD